MKKILTFVLCLCLGIFGNLGSFGVNAAKSEADDTTAKAIELLERLDIMKLTQETKEDVLTRAQFAIYAANIMGVDEYKPNDERYFLDVPMNHWALNSINSLAKNGILSVDDERLFNPDEKITYNQAAKILLCMMGYGQYCEVRGGYPEGYARTARQIGLRFIANGDEPLTVGDAALVIYDALHINLMDMTVISDKNNKYERAEDETLLSVYKNVYFKDGVVTSADTIGISNAYSTGKNEIMVDDTPFRSEEISALKYLGRFVTVYYRSDKDNSKDTVVHIQENDNKVVNFDIEDYAGIDTSLNLSYHYGTDGSKKQSVRLDAGISVLKNGENVSKNVIDAFSNLKKGDVTLIDDDNDGLYNTAVIREYRNIVVGSISAENYTIYDKYSGVDKLVLDDTDKLVRIFSEKGEERSFEDIKVGNILTVYDSNIYTEVYVSANEISGMVWRTEESDGKTKICFGAVEEDAIWYTLDSDYIKAANTMVYVGMNSTIKTDYFGNVAEVVVNKTNNMFYGYLVNIKNDDGFDGGLKMRIFDQSGEFVAYTTDPKIKVDGTAARSINKPLADAVRSQLALGKADITGQVIRYKLNSDGYISEIDTEYYNEETEGDMSLHLSKEKGSRVYTYSPRLFGMDTIINSNTITFAVPEDNMLSDADDDDFFVLPLSYFEGSTNHTVKAYKTNLKSGYEEVVVRYGDFARNTEKDLLILTEIYESLDNDGNRIITYSGYSGGILYTRTVSEDYTDEFIKLGLENGDMIREKIDIYGRVSSVRVLYDISKGGKPEWAPSAEVDSANLRYVYGNVISTADNVLKLGYNDIKNVDNVGDTGQLGAVVICDTKAKDGNRVYLGSKNDLIPAESVGEEACSKVIIRTQWRKMLWLVIIK